MLARALDPLNANNASTFLGNKELNSPTIIEAETMTTTGLKDALNLVADELMFIFFPEDCSKEDEWTVGEGSSRLSYLSSSYGGSYYTQETVSTVTHKESMKLISAMNVSNAKKKEASEEREEDLEPVPESDEEDKDTREGESSDSQRDSHEGSESEEESELTSVEDDVLNLFLSESDAMNLFVSESEDADGVKKVDSPRDPVVEAPTPTEQHQTSKQDDKSEKHENETVVEPKIVKAGATNDVIDLCDAGEVFDTSGEGTTASKTDDSRDAQRLHRLRETREKLRSEREKWEAEFSDDDSMQRRIKDVRGKRKGKGGKKAQCEQKQIERKMEALSRTLSGESGRARSMHSEEAIIEYHGKQIQKKIQCLSKILDDIMIKKLNGEFPDDAQTRDMEAAIRANLLEFHKWWHSSKPMHNVRPAPTRPSPEMRRPVWK